MNLLGPTNMTGLHYGRDILQHKDNDIKIIRHEDSTV